MLNDTTAVFNDMTSGIAVVDISCPTHTRLISSMNVQEDSEDYESNIFPFVLLPEQSVAYISGTYYYNANTTTKTMYICDITNYTLIPYLGIQNIFDMERAGEWVFVLLQDGNGKTCMLSNLQFCRNSSYVIECLKCFRTCYYIASQLTYVFCLESDLIRKAEPQNNPFKMVVSPNGTSILAWSTSTNFVALLLVQKNLQMIVRYNGSLPGGFQVYFVTFVVGSTAITVLHLTDSNLAFIAESDSLIIFDFVTNALVSSYTPCKLFIFFKYIH
jgi:hypothetical protein